MAQAEERDFEEGILLHEIGQIRAKLPGIGTEKLHFELEEQGIYRRWGLKMGRDKLADLLARHGMLVVKKRSRVRTTNSMHDYRKYPNLAKDLVLTRPNQLWVCDITYVAVGSGYSYLSLITDAYSRKIVGWALWCSLSAKGCEAALEMAIASSKKSLAGLLHHSDRGTQYCCNRYVKRLKSLRIGLSMTLNGDPYENALAERMNRTIKEEMLQNRGFLKHDAAEQAIRNAIEAYNELRPHASLDFKTPQFVHRTGASDLKKRWKKRPLKMTPPTTNPNPAGGGVTDRAESYTAVLTNIFFTKNCQPISG